MTIQQKILEYVIPLLEQAKVDEQKNIPATLVLDKAVPAERKSKPQRVLIVALATFFVFVISILIAFFMHSILKMDKEQNPLIRRMQTWVNIVMALYRVKV